VSVLTQASSANVEGDKLTLSNPDNSLVLNSTDCHPNRSQVNPGN